ncbi:MAG: hypothetical protein ACRBCI_11635 [Cellvibrionaceae bacterium]
MKLISDKFPLLFQIRTLVALSILSIALFACGGSSGDDSSEADPQAGSGNGGGNSQPNIPPSSPPNSPTNPAPPVPPVVPPTTALKECNDGIDNDGDGLVDWQFDVGCWGEGDASESSAERAQENGWTTFDLSSDSKVIYVSSSNGNDSNDGSSPDTAVATPERAVELVRDGFPDFILLKRGDVWRDATLGRFKSGRSATERLVISSYGDSLQRPKVEVATHFLNDNGQVRQFLAVTGLEITSYRKDPNDAAFNGTINGATGGGIRYVAEGSRDLLFEDNYLKYGEFVIQSAANIELRRNIIYRNYSVGTCAYNTDGSPNLAGDPRFRPSGIFAGGNDSLLLEENIFDGNGWNPDVDEACATVYNHNMYLASNKKTIVRANISLRASSIGLKLTANKGFHSSDDLLIDNNLFVEGEIGISIGGNTNTEHRFGNSTIQNNVFTDVGRNPPTKRELSWYIQVIDNDNTSINNNLFLNSPEFSGTFGISFSGGSNRSVTVENNYFYNLYRRNILFDNNPAWSDIFIRQNTMIGTSNQSCLIEHRGDFNNINYSENTYQSSASDNDWFCYDNSSNSLGAWMAEAGESNALLATTSPVDPGRNLERYSRELGLGATLNDFSDELRKQSRLTYNPALSTNAINDYIRAGYGQ